MALIYSKRGRNLVKICKLIFTAEEYYILVPVRDFTADQVFSFDGRNHLDTWVPLPVKRMEPEKGLELSDAPGWTFPMFSKKAVNILKPLIRDSVEFLELVFPESEYWGVNVTKVLDVINYEKAQFRTFPNSNRIMVFEKYAFVDSEELRSASIFKIIDEPRRNSFVTDRFKQLVEENKLTGFVFKEVWDSWTGDGR